MQFASIAGTVRRRAAGVVAAGVLFVAGGTQAATLERLSLDQMTAKSTAVVRGGVSNCQAAFRGRVIYTTCRLTAAETWKGRAPESVSVPGGSVNGVRQSYAGAPVLTPGEDKVFFLWTGPSGMTQALGLSQGILGVEKGPNGTVFATRMPGRDRMLDANGRPVADEGVDMPIDELRRLVTERAGR